MTRQFIAGGMYGDHLPTGTWVVLIPKSHMQTNMGRFELPPGETFGPLFVRCTDVDGVRFAGQAHDTTNPAAWEATVWPISRAPWKALDPPCCGVSPVIYDQFGLLHRSDCGPGLGSQGYRYVAENNQIVSGDATYKIDLGSGRFLFEYTDLGGLLIGQAAYDGGGVQVWDGSTLRQLELGDCRFVRANREDDVVALAFTRPDGVVLISTTLAELRALPVVVPPTNPIPVPPTPEPTTMRFPDNIFATLRAVRARTPSETLTPEQIGAILNETAWIHRAQGAGLQAKPSGTASVQPKTGLRIWNGLRIGNVGYDVCGACSVGRFTPVQADGGAADAASFVVPVEPGVPVPVPTPTPTPTPAPVGVTRAELDAAIAELQDSLKATEERLLARIAGGAAMDPAALRAAVEGVLAGYEVSGTTSRASLIPHSHTVKLGLQRKP